MQLAYHTKCQSVSLRSELLSPHKQRPRADNSKPPAGSQTYECVQLSSNSVQTQTIEQISRVYLSAVLYQDGRQGARQATRSERETLISMIS